MNVIKNNKAFTLLETLIALSILLMLLPLVSDLFYSSIKRYLICAEENKEIAQIEFAEIYLKKISIDASSIKTVGSVLEIVNSGTVHEVGVKNKKLYVMQTATRYLTVETMLITAYRFIRINDNYYQIELHTQTNRTYVVPIVRLFF